MNYREFQVEFCKVCTNRKMDLQQGYICKLTNKIADFDFECPDYELDKAEDLKILKRKVAAAGEEKYGHSVNFKNNKKVGLIIIVFGLVIILLTLSIPIFRSFFSYSFSILLVGLFIFIRGVEQKKVIEKYQEKKLWRDEKSEKE